MASQPMTTIPPCFARRQLDEIDPEKVLKNDPDVRRYPFALRAQAVKRFMKFAMKAYTTCR